MTSLAAPQAASSRVVDRHQVYPPDFRVEKIAGDQVALFDALGLLDSVAGAAVPFRHVANAHRGRILDRTDSLHHGILYDDLVRVVRAQFPPSVEFVTGRAVEIEAGPDRQSVTLARGGVIEARLAVLATGLGHALREKLGIRRRVVSEKHSLTFGFTLTPGSGEGIAYPALTYYGERVSDRIDYLNLFPAPGGMRGTCSRSAILASRGCVHSGPGPRRPCSTRCRGWPGSWEISRFPSRSRSARWTFTWSRVTAATASC